MIRIFRHWTPQYIFHRTLDVFYRKLNPDHPWLTPQAIWILDTWLTKDDIGIEWGSGKSTLWFAKRVKQLLSIEHDPVWYDKVSIQLKRVGAGNVDYHLLPTKTSNGSSPYADIAKCYPDQYFDFALVDGKVRHICMERILPKLRVGGILILDNSERYVPSDSKGTYFERNRLVREFAEEWNAVLTRLEKWRTVATNNGILCTRFWIKPCLNEDNRDVYSKNS